MNRNARTVLGAGLSSVVLAALSGQAAGQSQYSWRYYRLGNTGLQGDYNEAVWIGPDGDPYIGGYDPFFEEGGFSKFVQGENRWVNYSNIDYPVIGHPDDTGSARVSDIEADHSGMLWLGTWNGVLKFDPAVGASSLAKYGPADSAVLGGRTNDVDVAPDGTIWFTVISVVWGGGGTARYNPATDTWDGWVGVGGGQLAVQPKPSGGYFVWAAQNYNGYVQRFDSATQAWTTMPMTGAIGEMTGLPGKGCVDGAGNLWAWRLDATGERALNYRRIDGTWGVPPQPPIPLVIPPVSAFRAYGDRRALLADGNGAIWRFNGTSWQNLGVWSPGMYTQDIRTNAAGDIWVCGVGGAAKRNPATGAWQRYRVTNTANFDDFNRDLTIDPVNGHVYTGANAAPGVGGMVRFDGTRWTCWDQLTYGLGHDWPFPDDDCQALAYRRSNGAVAVCPYWSYGIHEWTGSGFNTLLPVGGAKRMCEDSLGRLWSLGEYFSLSYHDGNDWTSVPITAWGIGIAKDPTRPGTVWAWTGYEFVRTDGAYRFSRTTADFPELTDNTDQFLGLAVGANGVAWVGATALYDGPTPGGALIRVDADTGTYQILRSSQGWPFPGDTVTPWAVTPDGRLWMQYDDSNYPYTERGLCWYDGTNVGAFPAPPGGEPQWGGLPHAQIEDLEARIIPGGYELWMTCVSRGIAVLKVTGSCPADFNGDGFVDGIDYDQFNNAFEIGDMAADFNGDGFVDGIDYDQFNNAFEAGC